jgi:hypothetical protein
MLNRERHEETLFSFSETAPRPPERRREPRHLTILRVGAMIGPQGRELCLIRNISAGGFMAHVYSRHVPGEAVAIELKTNQQIAGKVIWADEANIGVRFDEPVDVGEMLASQAALANGWRPRMPRVEVDRLATVRCGARLYAVNTRDISQGGVKVETDQPLDVDRDVVVTLDRFRPVHGNVRWCRDGLAGIAFHQPLSFHELMGWLKPEASQA